MPFTRITLAAALAASLNVQANDTDVLANGTYMDVISDQLFDAASHTITVTAPDGRMFTETQSGDAVASIDLVYAFGKVLPDGLYQYEIQPNAAAQTSAVPDNLRGLATEKNAPIALESMSGAFTVSNGVILDPNEVEASAGPIRNDYMKPSSAADSDGPTLKDQVISDDLIVIGSGCIGIDCVNGESFGFDTLRLKENNLRINFDDTSASGSFPSNDWEITANDSNNGGASYLGFLDRTANRRIVTFSAGAPANSLFIKSSGDVGLGNSNPVVELHVTDGDSPALRLEQNGSSGFQAQTWDLAGNETNFFIRDVTNGSKLPFKIRPGADTNSLVIEQNGNISMNGGDVGIGTTSPDSALHVRGGAGGIPIATYERSDVSARMDVTASAGDPQLRFNRNGDLYSIGNDAGTFKISASGVVGTNDVFSVDNAGDVTIAGSLTQGSSRAIKEGFRALSGQVILDAINSIQYSEWRYSKAPATTHFGPMAEDFYAAFGFGPSQQHIAPGDMAGVALAAVKALDEKNQSLRTEIAELEERMEKLSSALEALQTDK